MSTENTIELTAAEIVVCEAARQAWKGLRRQTFESWLTLGKGLATLRAKADTMGGRKAFQRLLAQEQLDVLNKSTTTRLLQIIERLPDVVAWHEGLAGNMQVKWASPSAIHLHCPVFKTTKTDTPKRTRTVRQPIARDFDVLTARNAELEQELAGKAASDWWADAPEQIAATLLAYDVKHAGQVARAISIAIDEATPASDPTPARTNKRPRAKAVKRKAKAGGSMADAFSAALNAALDNLGDE